MTTEEKKQRRKNKLDRRFRVAAGKEKNQNKAQKLTKRERGIVTPKKPKHLECVEFRPFHRLAADGKTIIKVWRCAVCGSLETVETEAKSE